MTTIVHLVMTLPADKLALFIEACDHQESVFALVQPAAYLKFIEQITRGGEVAKLMLEFRRKLGEIKTQPTEEEE
jgi:hypothetical protein